MVDKMKDKILSVKKYLRHGDMTRVYNMVKDDYPDLSLMTTMNILNGRSIGSQWLEPVLKAALEFVKKNYELEREIEL